MIINKAEFLLPSQGVNLSKWSVIACDQFTSQRDYWQQLDEFVGDSPSTLRIIYPEVYLADGDKEKRIKNVYEAMRRYEEDGTLCRKSGVIAVDRTISDKRHRLGLVATVDLEEYDFSPVNNARVKATEKTVEERLPARIEVRRGATLESAHVMLLMQHGSFIRDVLESQKGRKPVYDFDLNMNGGHLAGYLIEDCDGLLEKLDKITSAQQGISYAVGDGNHSLATAKKCWEEIKKGLSEEEAKSHPARYAMVEIVDIYDDSLDFEPIHRVLFGAGDDALKFISDACSGNACVTAVQNGKSSKIAVCENSADAIADIQNAIDRYIALNPKCSVDYVHGDAYALDVAKKNGAIAILMPTVAKDGLFDYAARRGVLPRKSFSMGNAEDKRYYFETRKIK